MPGAWDACAHVAATAEARRNDGAMLDEVSAAGAFQVVTMEVCNAEICRQSRQFLCLPMRRIFSLHRLAASGPCSAWRHEAIALCGVVQSWCSLNGTAAREPKGSVVCHRY